MGQIDNTAMSPDLSELPMLVGKLRLVGESDEATKAAGMLASMAMDADNRVAISKVDGVLAALVTMLCDGNMVGKEKAAGTLLNLAVDADNQVAIGKQKEASISRFEPFLHAALETSIHRVSLCGEAFDWGAAQWLVLPMAFYFIEKRTRPLSSRRLPVLIDMNFFEFPMGGGDRVDSPRCLLPVG